MSKRTILLIVILALITVGLLALAFLPSSKNTQLPQGQVNQPTLPSAPKETVLSFSPEIVQVGQNATTSAIQVVINTGSNKITAAQLEINYDPKVLLNVQVTPGTFFPNPSLFFNTVDSATGKISYALGVSPSESAVSGTGTVATITFTPVSAASIISSPITFTDKSLVTAEGSVESVLKETKNAVITFPQQ